MLKLTLKYKINVSVVDSTLKTLKIKNTIEIWCEL